MPAKSCECRKLHPLEISRVFVISARLFRRSKVWTPEASTSLEKQAAEGEAQRLRNYLGYPPPDLGMTGGPKTFFLAKGPSGSSMAGRVDSLPFLLSVAWPCSCTSLVAIKTSRLLVSEIKLVWQQCLDGPEHGPGGGSTRLSASLCLPVCDFLRLSLCLCMCRCFRGSVCISFSVSASVFVQAYMCMTRKSSHEVLWMTKPEF